ncbi:tetratricopeptide repeat protein [Methylothermus subterraneus]
MRSGNPALEEPDRLAKPGLWLQAWLIAAAIGFSYGHTLDVPFYLDDYLTVQTNPAVKQFDLGRLWHEEPLRFLGYLSLALDYKLHGLEVAGYHFSNLLLHFLAALALWQLVRELVKTPAGQNAAGAGLPLAAALLFAVHPLQTQAVTYISQRFAVLAALFYLTALVCYLRLRLASGLRHRLPWGVGLVLAAALALLSKQNAATLPLAILWVEMVCFPASRHAAGLRLGALAALGLGLGLLWAVNYLPPLKFLDRLTRETDWFGRSDYLAAQVKVLWWYLRLFFWPLGLRLDYAAHQTPTWSDPWVIVAAWGHLTLIGLALWNLKRAPLAAFGVLFYYTAHLVESSIVPIRDLIFEHRTYLPNAGLSIACAFGLLVWLPRRLPRLAWLGPGVFCLALVGLLWQTWQRNQFWRDPIAFWEDNVHLEPQALRPKLELAREYFNAGRVQESLALGRQIAASTPWPPKAPLPQSVVANLAAAYLVAGDYDLALRAVEDTLKRPLLPQVKKRLYWVRGSVYLAQKRYSPAEADYRAALSLDGEDAALWLSLGEALLAQGKSAKAKRAYRKALALEPDNALAKQRLAQLGGGA